MADDDGKGKTDPPAGKDDGKDWQAEAEKWKALARKHEDQSKANLSDMDKVNAKLAELEQKAADADARALRAEVAQAKKLTAAQAKRLQGATREELEADADELLEAFKPPADKGGNGSGGESGEGGSSSGEGEQSALPPSGRPAEKLTAGPGVPDTGGEKSPGELADSILQSDF